MAVNAATVTAIIAARETLSAAQTARLPTLITLAAGRLSESVFTTTYYDEAVALLVLHWLFKNPRAAGPMTAETEGRLSRSYASPGGNWQGSKLSDLDSTSYGRELQDLGKMVCGGIAVRTSIG